MKLFIKIFLWFLAAIALMVGVIIFVTRTFQTEPMFSRFKRSTQNQMTIYGDTATQIVNAEGEAGLRQFLERLRDMEPSREINLVASNGTLWFGDSGSIRDVADFAKLSIESNATEADFSPEDRTIGYAPVSFPDGRRFAMVLQWERPPSSSLFWGSTTSYIRLLGILLTATILCYLLALYLTSPIRKLRAATNQLAAGDLQTRVAPKIGRRRDELGDLARDFDEMAVRIESLITSQQRLNRDISHELRSPLARLNVALEIAKQKSNAETKPMLDRIEAESTRLNDMIGRLLTLAQLESGAVDVERIRVDLAELVRDVAADADFEAKAKGRHVAIKQIAACSVVGSESLLRSAIENVLRNAVKYTAEGTIVEVALTASNGRATVTVADHGGGVPEDELPNLFRPFYRVGEARERKTGGIGLGLAIAERAVKAHKGKITAHNANGGLRIDIELEKA